MDKSKSERFPDRRKDSRSLQSLHQETERFGHGCSDCCGYVMPFVPSIGLRISGSEFQILGP